MTRIGAEGFAMDRSRCGGRDWFLATDDADVLLRRRMCRERLRA